MFNRTEWKMITAMMAVNFCLVVDFMIVMPQGPHLMRAFSIGAKEFSWLVTGYTLGAGAMGILSSFFIDRFDRKKSLLFFLAGFAISNSLCAFAPSYGAFVFTRALTGAMGGVAGTLIFAILSDTIDPRKRSTAFGCVFSAFALASIIGLPICIGLSNRLSWQAPYFLICLLSSLLVALFAYVLPELRSHMTSARAPFILADFARLAFGEGRLAALTFVAVLILGHFSINPFLFSSLVMNAGLPEAKLPIVYVVIGVISVFSSVLFGKLSDVFGHKQIFAISLLASLAGIYAVTHLSPSPLGTLIFYVTSFMVLMGARLTPALTMVSETSPLQERGRFLSLVGSVQQLATAGAAGMAGAIVSKTSDGHLENFGTVGLIAMGLSGVALILGLRLKSTPQAQDVASSTRAANEDSDLPARAPSLHSPFENEETPSLQEASF